MDKSLESEETKQRNIKDEAESIDSAEHKTKFSKENTQAIEEMTGIYGVDKDDVVLTALTLLYMVFKRTKTASQITVTNKEKESFTFTMPSPDK